MKELKALAGFDLAAKRRELQKPVTKGLGFRV